MYNAIYSRVYTMLTYDVLQQLRAASDPKLYITIIGVGLGLGLG